MSIITLTTDLGTRDNYVALVKAYILKNSESALIVDVSHEIDKYNIQQAAYVFGNAFYEFPKDTIHVLAIKSANLKHDNNLIVRYKEQYILCPDNGLFSLFYDGGEVVFYHLNKEQYPDSILYPRDTLSKAAIDIANGKFLTDIAEEIPETLQALNFQPTSSADSIVGKCIHLDSFGNVITNIKKSFFEESRRGRGFTIHLPNLRISEISDNYDDVSATDALALFNSSGHLEIAINKGAARQLLFPRNLHTHTDFNITIEFE